jgi:hypothetical protein
MRNNQYIFNMKKISTPTFRAKVSYLSLRQYIACLVSTAVALFSLGAHAQTYTTSTATFTAAGTYTWIAPCGVTSVQVECWGGGGGGGGSSNAAGDAGGGGAGGSYAVTTSVPVVPGNTYTVTIGSGGTAGTNTGTTGGTGGTTSFNITSVVATGGQGGTGSTSSATPGIGGTGTTTGNAGGVFYAGGNGGTGVSATDGGGGGGGAGNSAAGGIGSAPTAGTGGVTGGGNGGAGSSGATASAGSAPGGGGGAPRSSNTTGRRGGAGGIGRVVLTFGTTLNTSVVPTITLGTVTSSAAILSWSSASGQTYQIAYGPTATGPFTIVSGTSTGSTTTDTISGLTASSTYYYQVAVNCPSPFSVQASFATACLSYAIPYFQGFNSGSIPGCWSQQYVSGANDLTYASSDANPNTTPEEGSGYLEWNSYDIFSGETRLVSPPLNTTSTSSVDVRFYWFYDATGAYPSYNDNMNLQYSLDGINWTTVSNYSRIATGNENGWTPILVTLPAAAANQTNLYIGLDFISADGDNCSLDSFLVLASPQCTGAPTAGTATPGIVTGSCNPIPVTVLSLINNTAGLAGLTYQWQSSTSATGPFTNIPGANSASYTAPSTNSSIFYQAIEACANTNDSSTSTVAALEVVPFNSAAIGVAAGYTPIAATGWNQDVISNGIGAPATSTTTDVDGVGYYFYDNTYSDPAAGATPSYSLPANGQIISGDITGLLYQLQPSAGNNSLQLTVGGTATGTLTFPAPTSTPAVYLLTTSGSGASTMDVTVNFSDTSGTETFTGLAVADWFSGTPFAEGGFGRVNGPGNFSGTSGAGCPGGSNSCANGTPRMYDVQFSLDPSLYSKHVSSITVTNTSSNGSLSSDVLNIFAVSAAVSAPAPFCGGLATSVSLFNPPAGTTYQWQSSATQGGPYTNVTGGTGATTTTYTTTNTGAVYYVCNVTCTTSGTSVVSNEVFENISPVPTVSVTPDTSNYCSGGAGVTLTASGTATSYSWSGPGLNTISGTTVVASPSATTIYTVTGLIGTCSASATALVNYLLSPAVTSIIDSPSSICAGGTSQLNVLANTPIAAACIPSIIYTYDDYLQNITITDTTNTTTYLSSGNNAQGNTPNNYVSHGLANSTGALVAGTKYSLNTLTGEYDEGVAVWIDYNQNGVFDNNEVILAAYTPGGGFGNDYMDSFVVPLNAINGVTNLRVRLNEGTDTIPDANGLYSCSPGNFGDGSTDDFSVTITGGVNPAPLTYSWSPSGTLSSSTISNPVATPANGITTYTVSISDGICATTDSVSDTVGVALAIAPTATTLATGIYCARQTTFLLSANRTGGGAPFHYTWTSVPAGFTSSASAVNVTPDNITTYYLTVTDTCGSTISDSVIVTVVPTPLVTISPTATTFCTGGSPVTLTASGAATYFWPNSSGLSSDSGAIVTASPAISTTYTVTGANALGCAASASTSVSVSLPPAVSMISATPAILSICSNHQSQLDVVAATPISAYCIPSISDVTLHYLGNINVTDTTGSNTIISFSNIGLGSPGTTNNYEDNGTSSTLGSYTAGTNYDFNGTYGGAYEGLAIWIDLNQNGVFDNNELLYAHYGGGNAGGTPFSGSFNIPATALSGTTTMRVRDMWGSDTLSGPNGLYSCSPGNSDGFNTYGETDDFTVTITGGVTPNSLVYVWSPSASLSNDSIPNPVASPAMTQVYTVTATDPNTGCSTTQADTVTITPALPLTDSITGAATVCLNGNGILTAYAAGGCGPYTYAWSPAGSGGNSSQHDSIAPLVPTVYTVTVTDSGGAQVTATYSVNILSPSVNATKGDTACSAPGTLLLTGTPSAGASIVWYDSLSGGQLIASGDSFTTPSIDTVTTYYAFAVTTSPVCTSAAVPVVALIRANPALTLNNNIISTCPGIVAPITITSSIPAHSSYIWTPITGLYTNAAGTTAYTGGNASSLYGLPVASTSYTVSLLDSATGCSSSARDSFQIYQLPTAGFTGSDTAICPGTVLTETVNLTGTGPWTLTRTNDGGTIVTTTLISSPYAFLDTPAVSGPIKVTSLNDAHCSAVSSGLDSINVTIDSIAASFTSSETYAYLGDNITFSSIGSGAVSYSWTFGDGDSANTQNPTHTYGAIGIYTVTLTVYNASGCSSTISGQDTVTYPLGISTIPTDQTLRIYSYLNNVMVDFSQYKTVDATIRIYDIIGQELSNESYHSPDTYVKVLNDVDAAYIIVSVKMSDGQIISKKLFISK